MNSVGAQRGRGGGRRVYFRNYRRYSDRDQERYNNNTRSNTDYGPRQDSNRLDSRTMSKSLDQITEVLQQVNKRLDQLENPDRSRVTKRRRRFSYSSTRESSPDGGSRSSTVANTRSGSPQGDPMPAQMRKIFNYTRVLHHSDNWGECPRGISKAVDRVIFNIHPPLPDEGLREQLKQLGEDFKTQICDIVLDHLNKKASDLMEEIEPLSKEEIIEIKQDITFELQQNRSRVKDNTITLALNKLYNAKPKRTVVVETPVKKHPRESSDDDENNRNRKARAIQEDSDETIDLSNIEEDDVESNLVALSEAVMKHVGPTKFFKLDKKLKKQSHKWNLNDVDLNCEKLIITGSNGRHFAQFEIPDKTQIVCVPGINLERTVLMLNETKQVPNTLQVIVFGVGLNDREIKDQSHFTTYLQDIKQWTAKYNIRPIFSGISWAETLPQQLKINLGCLNVLLKDMFREDYIPPIVEEEVVIEKYDLARIHFDAATARLWFDKITEHLKDLTA